MTFLYPSYLDSSGVYRPRTITTNAYGQRLTSWLLLCDLRECDKDEAIEQLLKIGVKWKVSEKKLDALRHFQGVPVSPTGRTDLMQATKAVADEAADEAIRNGGPEDEIRSLQAYVDEAPIVPSFDENFGKEIADRRIIGIAGCGDLTMNFFNVAFINSPLSFPRARLLFLPGEPIDQRTYSCLVKWKAGNGYGRSPVTIEDVQFFSPSTTINDMVWAMVNKGDGELPQWAPCGDKIEFACSNQQVIRDGAVTKVSQLTHQFSDLRHLLVLPNLNLDTKIPGLNPPDPGRGNRKFFGDHPADDVWLGEKQLLDDINLQRAAMGGPVVLNRLYGGLSVSQGELRGAMNNRGYTEVPDPANAVASDYVRPLRTGEYRFLPEDDRQFEVFFRRNVYPWNIIGLSADGHTLYHLACEGDRGRIEGFTLEEASEQLRAAGAQNALLIDEGDDVFQAVDLDPQITSVSADAVQRQYPDTYAVATGSALSLTIPQARKRTRLRAVFLFARSLSRDQKPASPS